MALQNVRSNTADKRPTAAGLSDGQIALNTNAGEPGLFFKDASGNIRKIGPIAVGTTAPNSSPATGGSSGNSAGEAWFDTTTTPPVFKIYDGSDWIAASSLPLSGGTLSGQLLLDDAASAAAPDLAFDGDANTGIFSPADDNVAISTAGTQRLVVNPSGNVGINVASPTVKLDVGGTVKATSVDATTVDGDTVVVNDKVELPNKEKGNLSADGEFSFDSSQGLIVYRTQQGVTGTGVTVLDGANVQAGSNINISNLGAGDTGTGRITFSVDSNNLDADTVDGFEANQFLRSDASDTTTGTITAPSFQVTSGGKITDVTGSYGSVKVTGGATSTWKGYAIEESAVFMDSGTSFGLYDDTNNHWAIKHNKNGDTELYYDGSKKLETSSAGGTLTGTWTGTVTNAQQATQLTNNRTIWGKSFNGTANVTGALTGATTITGTAANMTIQPADSTASKTLFLRGNDNTTSGATGGGVVVGHEGRGDVVLRTSNLYKFAKAGQQSVTGDFRFNNLTQDRTYDFPNSGGTIALTSSTVSNATTAANCSRSVSSGDGLTGGGTLTSNRTLSVNSSVVRTTGNQTLGGNKTFTGTTTMEGNLLCRGALDLADNDILRFGGGDDAEFFTNGSHFYLDLNNGIGNFYIRDGTTTRYTFNDNGNFTATGSINANSFSGTLGGGDVRQALAGANVGNLGTYAFCELRNNSGNNDRSQGHTTSGSNLRYTNANANSAGTPGGSWRLMGRIAGDSENGEPKECSVWLRYA